MKRLVCCAAVLLSLACAGLASAQNAPPPEWRQFRESYRYHIQGVAVSKPRPDGSRVVIVAEPPPHLDTKRLATIFSSATSVQFPRNPVGYDGWVCDAVAVLPRDAEPAIEKLVDTLHREMFHTTYKAFLLPMHAETPASSAEPASLNRDVSAADLRRWLLPPARVAVGAWRILGWTFLVAIVLVGFKRSAREGLSGGRFAVLLLCVGLSVALVPSRMPDPSSRFSSIGGTESLSARDILEKSTTGLFVSREPGLVLLGLSSTAPLVNSSVDLRRFALDSDLILGAVKRGNHVVIVGRERVEPVNVLPPLRVETILQLASVREDELSQSYERRNVIAGRYDESHDWAPIYLSAALIDTEYGSLLNITDQLLKSWSMKGTVYYYRFTYPKPASYPFPSPLIEYANVNRVTFNWNTKGAGYAIDTDGVSIMALNRTGALPVDYLGGEDTRLVEAEDRAYEYFSSTGDPNLVRVVQYAGLYQVFRRFGIATPPARLAEPILTPRIAQKGAAAIVDALRRIDETKLEKAIQSASAGPQADPRAVSQLEALLAARKAVEALYTQGGDARLVRLSQALAAPRDFHVAGRDDEIVLSIAHRVMSVSVAQLLDLPLGQIMSRYVLESIHPVKGWIRTPSIVVSWQQRADGSPGVLGGHNLSAKVSSMLADSSVPAGSVRVAESEAGRVLHFNSADESRIAGVVRRYGRGEKKPAAVLESELNDVLRAAKTSNRAVAEAVAFKAVPNAPRGLSPRHVPGTPAELGWRFSNQVPNSAQIETLSAVADARSPVFILERTDDGTFALYNDSGRHVLTAGNTVSASDGLGELIREADPALGPVRLHIRGMNANEGKGFVEAVELRLPREQRGRITGTLEDGRMGVTDLKRILSNDFDFSKARINRVSEPVYSAKGAVVDVEMNVPARVASRPSLLVRVKLFFEGVAALPAQITAAVRNIVSSWVAALRPQLTSAEFATAVKALERDLSHVHPSIKVDAVLTSEGKDIHVARNDLDGPFRVLAHAA